MRVLKFGGSSVGSEQGLKNLIKIVLDNLNSGQKVAVIVSAFGKTTDQLIQIARSAAQGDEHQQQLKTLEDFHRDTISNFIKGDKALQVLGEVNKTLAELKDVIHGVFLVREISPRTLDYIMGFGERLSAYIISETIRQSEPNVNFLDARQVVRTDTSYGSAVVDIEWTRQNIINYFKKTEALQIITGFIGQGPNQEATTLGRGGSDYTAALFGAALNAEVIEIWTDVDGVLTADPRKVKNAFSVSHITYEEAMELSHFGAKVIYPLTMQPALDAKIPILIKNTFNPEGHGTVVSFEKTKQRAEVTGISSISHVALFRVQGSGMVGVAGIASRLFNCLARRQISVILISQASSEHSICFAVDPKSAELAKETIEEEFALELKARYIDPINVETNMAVVAAIGESMRQTPGIAGKLFQALGKNGINIIAIAQGSSELNISFVISSNDETKALNVIHDAFFLSDFKSVNLFLIGPGSVGSMLLEQFRQHAPNLETSHQLKLRVVGLANRSKMLIQEDGIDLGSWRETLNGKGQNTDIFNFVGAVKRCNLPHSIFIDCTADQQVASLYKELLASSISVVTPNKKANSGTYLEYCELKAVAKKANVKFFYETNVGAGLPVIGTLNDLLNSGDSVVRIEAVLSGTLSFIFNTYNGTSPFSAVVREAKEKGYTEPDPRDDLSGRDVMRKLMILGREMNLPLEEADVVVESLVPEDCQAAKNVDEFFQKLLGHDNEFSAKYKPAFDKNQVLRYIGKIENGKASVALHVVDNHHPFYSLSGSDNVISFTTTRYNNRPLVVKGPGAGVEVTAAGVFADIIKVSTYLM